MPDILYNMIMYLLKDLNLLLLQKSHGESKSTRTCLLPFETSYK